MECIGCAQCIDACDDVMKRLHKPVGLIRYDSLRALTGQPRRMLRPRLLIYGALVLASVTALVLVTLLRAPFECNVIRLNGAPYLLEAGTVRNQYESHVVNKNPSTTTFHIDLTGPVPMSTVIPDRDVQVGSLEHFRLPIFVSVQQSDFHHAFDMQLTLKDSASGESRVIPLRFLGPMGAIRP
jgi:polyferredoxin